MSYLVSVDVCPDTRDEEQREYEAELLTSGQAVKCTECKELLTAEDRGYEEYLCEKCASEDVDGMLKSLQSIIDLSHVLGDKRKNDLQTIKNFCSTYSDIFKAFLLGEVIDYEF